MSQKIVTVVGATGQQGQAVIAAFAGNPSYHIRGITRNPAGAVAKKLTDQGIKVVKADIGDLDSITAAFKGSHIIFAVTDFHEPYQTHGPIKAKEIEKQQGITMAKAASVTSSLEHYIWSTLPRTSEKFPVYHFESKYEVDGFIKSDAVLLEKTTFLMISYYANNLQIASFRPYWIGTVKKYTQFTTYEPEVLIPFIGDVSNVTPFVKAVVENPERTKNGAMVLGNVGDWTAKHWVEAWATGKGAEVQLMKVSRADYNALFPWPRCGEEFALMMDYFAYVPRNEWVDADSNILTAEDLNVTPVQTLEEWAKTYELPDMSVTTL